MKTTQWLWSAVLAATVSACASQQAQTASPQPATGAAAETQIQKQKVTGAAMIDGANLMVYKNRAGHDAGKKISLVDALKATGKKVAIIQFAGVQCTDCIDTSLAIEKMIKASPKGQSIVHILVLSDFFSDYSDEEFHDYVAKMAPDSYPVYDEATVWKKYISDVKAPRATVIAMNLDQEATVSTKSGQELTIVPAAEALVK